MFRAYITEHINLQIRIKDRDELDEAMQYFTAIIQEAAWHSTPQTRTRTHQVDSTPLHIRELIAEKRRSRGRWQRSCNRGYRIIYNRLQRKLQTALRNANNATFEHYTTTLSPSDNTLWKATKTLKRPQIPIPPIRKPDGSWAKSDDEKSYGICGPPPTGVHIPPYPYSFRHRNLRFLRCPLPNVATYQTLYYHGIGRDTRPH